MEAPKDTIEAILEEMRFFKCRNLKTNELEKCPVIQCYLADRIDKVYKRDVGELKKLLLKAYDALYSISCSRYGEGLTCTDNIHEIVTFANKRVDELYENNLVHKIVETRGE